MEFGQYSSLVQAGTYKRILKEFNKWMEMDLTLNDVDREIYARMMTRPPPKVNKPPKFFINKKFFVKLNLVPSVDLEVRDSVSKIRRECYGFREEESGERVYLRIDRDSVVMFRDSPAGFIIGKRYFVPRLHKMNYPRCFRKVNRLLTRVLSEQGIIINSKHVLEYTRQHRKRWQVANLLVTRRKEAIENEIKKQIKKNRR